MALSAAFATVQREGLPGTGAFKRVVTRWVGVSAAFGRFSGCLTAGGWRAAAAPSVPSPHSVAQGSRPPDKEREPTAYLGSLNACRAATAGAGGEGSPGISDPRATGKRASPKELWKESPRECTVATGASPPRAKSWLLAPALQSS